MEYRARAHDTEKRASFSSRKSPNLITAHLSQHAVAKPLEELRHDVLREPVMDGPEPLVLEEHDRLASLQRLNCPAQRHELRPLNVQLQESERGQVPTVDRLNPDGSAWLREPGAGVGL